MKSLLTLVLIVAVTVSADDKKPEMKFDAAKLVGKWTLVDGKKNGEAIQDFSKSMGYEFTKDKIMIKMDGKDMFVMEYKLDEKASPVAIDMTMITSPDEKDKGQKAVGIVELGEDTLKIAYDPKGKERPTKFDGEKSYFFSLKKAKEEKK